jgi:hypothetical protein
MPSSTIRDDLCAAGYDVSEAGDGERILPSAIAQKFVTGPDGELEPLTSGSTRVVALTVTHVGISRVVKYGFSLD